MGFWLHRAAPSLAWPDPAFGGVGSLGPAHGPLCRPRRWEASLPAHKMIYSLPNHPSQGYKPSRYFPQLQADFSAPEPGALHPAIRRQAQAPGSAHLSLGTPLHPRTGERQSQSGGGVGGTGGLAARPEKPGPGIGEWWGRGGDQSQASQSAPFTPGPAHFRFPLFSPHDNILNECLCWQARTLQAFLPRRGSHAQLPRA